MAMDLLTFAAQRDADLVAATDEYTPQVEAALAEPDPADSHAALLLVLAAGFAAAYLAQGGDEDSKTDATLAFVAMMRSAVELTEPDGTEAQVERVSTWFATATLGAATLAAAESTKAPGDVVVKTWVTMRDEKVRHTHAPLDGEFREMQDTFEVKTNPPADLLFPGQPVGPVEAWINCRCVLNVGTEALIAGAVDSKEWTSTTDSSLAPRPAQTAASTGPAPSSPTSGEASAASLAGKPSPARASADARTGSTPDEANSHQWFDTLATAASASLARTSSPARKPTTCATGTKPVATGPTAAPTASTGTPTKTGSGSALAATGPGSASASPASALPPTLDAPSGPGVPSDETAGGKVLDVEPLIASGASGFSGVVLVALPAGDGTVTYEDGDTTELHQTLAYLGEVDELQPGEREELLAVGEALASMVAPFSAKVAGLASLGEDQDTVAITESADLQALHEMARSNETIEAMYQARNGHPTWISHVTAQDFQAGDEILFDRIGVWFGGDDHRTFAMTGEPVEAAGDMNEDVTDMEDSVDEPPVPDQLIEPEDADQPVYGVIAPEGVMSGDGRAFEPGTTTTRELPLPLSWVRSSTKEHDNSIVVGRVDSIDRRDDGNLWWAGVILGEVPESDEVIGLIADEALRGVSVDMDSAKVVQETDPDESGNVDTTYAGRVSGLTIVAIPAFEEAFIALGEDPALAPDTGDAEVEAGTESFARGPGWLTNPADTKRIHDYWTKGKGAAKIRWGTPGDFTRLRRHLAKYIDPRYLNRTVAQWHHDALGYWPGQCGMPGNPPCGKKRGSRIPGAALETINSEESPMIASNHSHSINLVAAAPPAALPSMWFDDPMLTGPTPLTVTASGQVFGHIAKWGTCHIGIDKVCVTPPKSSQNYAYFHLGSVLTSDGERAVGSLTLGTGHADLKLSSAETSRHYDHTGTVVAKVRAGEDDHGIWVAGALCEGVTEAQARTLMAAGGISGDWRSIGGHLELVAALAVNVPGFPVPRPALAASAGRQTALVAAGVVVVNDDPRIDAIAAAVVGKLTAAAARKSRLDDLAPVHDEARARRVAALQTID